jgi:hypothetical protein
MSGRTVVRPVQDVHLEMEDKTKAPTARKSPAMIRRCRSGNKTVTLPRRIKPIDSR